MRREDAARNTTEVDRGSSRKPRGERERLVCVLLGRVLAGKKGLECGQGNCLLLLIPIVLRKTRLHVCSL